MEWTAMLTQEQQLCQFLMELPSRHKLRYTDQAQRELLSTLFLCMAGGKREHLDLFFPSGGPARENGTLSLKTAQGAVEGAEYTEAARGKACGHIFKAGEASYGCRTCSADDTCVLCAKCFEATDHAGHMVRISVSPGNSGCCDCGDGEAWRRPVLCSIHSVWEGQADNRGKAAEADAPGEVVANMHMTVGRVLDYLCDVISCSPEQLRGPKTVASIEHDEHMSRLSRTYHGGDVFPPSDWAVLLWNDEKHTLYDVRDQVARACRVSMADGLRLAYEVDTVGRSILQYDASIEKLLEVAEVLERIRVTVTIRSARDTFREQMCGTMIEWLQDISACSVGADSFVLRRVVCEEMVKPWRKGSPGAHALVGKDGIDDEDLMDRSDMYQQQGGLVRQARDAAEESEDWSDEAPAGGDGDPGIDVDMAGAEGSGTASGTGPGAETAQPRAAAPAYATSRLDVPKTPGLRMRAGAAAPRPGRYWLTADKAVAGEGLARVRQDWLMLFDLRMWKKVRNDLRALYMGTVVTMPAFKRELGLRFAGLYTTLAQLYLIGDREPDHSIINLSLQMLTTPSITAEIVERGNFLTSLLAILYTFLSTRQVGHPWEVAADAVLSFESGSVTNRRIYHFFMDLKHLLASAQVQARVRVEEQYLLQFLDLVKLHQGICPNARAVGDHVEYETDSWISASLITREINRLCRQFGEAFRGADSALVARAIRTAAKSVVVHSLGAERRRFRQAEIQDEVRFQMLGGFEFEQPGHIFRVVAFVVEAQAVSFHHGLHYALSWLVECGKAMAAEQLRELLSFSAHELRAEPRGMGPTWLPSKRYEAEDYLMAAFDYPLRVCAWLAQMKAGMWVRNGLSLRHQAGTYRGVPQRDVSYQRDIFLLQTALVLCEPGRVVASLVDRFGLDKWVRGDFGHGARAQDDMQRLDVAEDMLHLLIVLLSDRAALMPAEDAAAAHARTMRRDIAHALVFRPLSFNELVQRLPDKYAEHEDFHRLLGAMATFRAPDGLADAGTFELQAEHVQDVDPYVAHYSRNQRDESETACRAREAQRTGQAVELVVYEPHLPPIPTGVFRRLGRVTGCGMFAQVVYYALLYPLVAQRLTPAVPLTRVEAFLQLVLHLVLIAVAEDGADDPDQPSFLRAALTQPARVSAGPEAPAARTMVALLTIAAHKPELASCHAKIGRVLERMRQKRPGSFSLACRSLGLPADRIGPAAPAGPAADDERARKKQAALDRQARVLAQLQAQQQSFLARHGDGGADPADDATAAPAAPPAAGWAFPGGRCILCQEAADGRRLYGTFALLAQSRNVRRTDFGDAGLVREVMQTPENLDRSAEDVRPFGRARENGDAVRKINARGEVFWTERQRLGRGFDAALTWPGPVSVGCGHVMHYGCFENYFEATVRRHQQQIARHAPEDTLRLEFVCPLCKALGNAFLPIVWNGHEDASPVPLRPTALAAVLGEHLAQGAHETVAPALDALEAYLGRKTVAGVAGGLSELKADAAANTSTPAAAMVRDLVSAYRRLRRTIATNQLIADVPAAGPDDDDDEDDDDDDDDELRWSGSLASAVGFTIATLEIQQRGVEAAHGMTLLQRVPDQVLTHLRVLAETVRTYLATGCLHRSGCRGSGLTGVAGELRRDALRQHAQLFAAGLADAPSWPPLLAQDSFLFLSECVFGLLPCTDVPMLDLVRLCYLAEMIKFCLLLKAHVAADQIDALRATGAAGDPHAGPARLAAFYDATHALALPLQGPAAASDGFAQSGCSGWAAWYAMLRKYCLTYLRKCVLLLYAAYGLDFDGRPSLGPDKPELERLSEMLCLPSLADMLGALTPPPHDKHHEALWPPSTTRLVNGWVAHWQHAGAQSRPSLPALPHPGIFELVGLPRNYDAMLDLCTRIKCPTTGRDVSDPTLCLFCAAVFCGQGICCSKEEKKARGVTMMVGGSQQHLRKCQGNFGLFINIRKCTTFYLHRLSGAFGHAPYVDKYGESDMQLRHCRQLYLHQKRYDAMLRNLVLSHGIPSFIARKLEAEINNGGWETL